MPQHRTQINHHDTAKPFQSYPQVSIRPPKSLLQVFFFPFAPFYLIHQWVYK